MPTPTTEDGWPKPKWRFEYVRGYFVYEDETNPPQLPGLAPNFGLREGKTWKGLMKDLQDMNSKATDGIEYKLIFAGRHGQGNHNVGEEKYGTRAWDDKWALLTGDSDGLIWGPDPYLTELGIEQAQAVNTQWRSLLASSNADPPPLPTMLFSSPMTRAAQTLQTTFDGVLLGGSGNAKDSELTPIAKELWRETLGNTQAGKHTCDARISKKIIRERFPDFNLDDVPEEDELFDVVDEEESNMYVRIKSALSQTWEESKGHTVLSVTSHSGVMRGLFDAIGHPAFKPKICGVVPLLVKATPVKS